MIKRELLKPLWQSLAQMAEELGISPTPGYLNIAGGEELSDYIARVFSTQAQTIISLGGLDSQKPEALQNQLAEFYSGLIHKLSLENGVSVKVLADVIASWYSVTDPDAIRKQYLAQIAQYPFYLDWFDLIEAYLVENGAGDKILEYGSGPGILTSRLSAKFKGGEYFVIEPSQVFREMTLLAAEQGGSRMLSVLGAYAEDQALIESGLQPSPFVVMTAAYHHFYDKPLALVNIYRSLCPGGHLVMGEVFLPDYDFDGQYYPTDMRQFVMAIVRYVVAQIQAMPSPTTADIEDQLRTALLDMLGHYELKVCLPILLAQLEDIGFSEIKFKNMDTDEQYSPDLGWYFITARR